MNKVKKKAQTGANIPPIQPTVQPPMVQPRFGTYTPAPLQETPRSISTLPPGGFGIQPGRAGRSNFADIVINAGISEEQRMGGRVVTEDELDGAGRYDYFQPSSMGINNEDVAAQYQGWGEKAVNGVLKGGSLALTTFLQGTVGAVNGLYQWANTGKFSSFYDNDFNRELDNINKYLENQLPNYYTNEELNASWYSPQYWATGNFLWDGVIKNLGFAAGAYYSGLAYASALRALPLTSRLFSTGKAAETLQATEKGLKATNRGAGVYGEVKKLSDNFLNQYNLLNPGGRFLVAGLATSGEASIEALHNMNDYRDQLIGDYKNEFGIAPTGEALNRINMAAEGAGNSSYAMNVAVLSASNYIMFPMIGRSGFGRDKTVLNNLTRETNELVYKGGRLVPKTSKLHPLLRSINKIRPYTFSVTEASEEAFQYGAAVASKDYYNKQYNNQATDWLESLGVGLTDGVFSDEGAKNALIGGISGRIMTFRGMLARDRAKAANTQQAVEEINNFELSDFTKETMYAVNRAGVIIEEMQQAAQNGDEFTYKQLEKDFIINYLTPRIKYGRYDLVKQDIADAKKLASTEEGFAQLQSEGKVQEGDTREAYIRRMENLEKVAENTSSLYQSLMLRYGGITRQNPVTGEFEAVYTPSVIDKLIYTGVSTASLDTQIQNLIQELSQGLPNVNFDQIITDILNNESQSFNEANDIITNLDAITEVKDELGKGLQDLAALAKLREKYIQEYQNIQENPDQFREEPMAKAPEDLADNVDTIVVKTKGGSRTLVIGGEYFVGQGVDFNESPLTEPVVVAGFTLLNQNEDGTIRVKTDNGQIKDFSPEKLLDFKVSAKANLATNKTANYYYNHRNDLFEFNFGKNFGGKKQGRLAYINDKLYFVYKDFNGNLFKKELANKFFLPQEGFNQPRIKKIGKLSDAQKKSEKDFLSPEELAKGEQTLAKNRESRVQILNDLGVEQQRRLEELTEQIRKDKEKLAKIKEDFKNIEIMKDGRRKRVTLNFSKAQKNFTRAINKLTEMQADTEQRIKEAEAQQEELAFNISYFSDFGKDLLDLPGNTGVFLKELQDQVKLLEQQGKQLAKEQKANNDLLRDVKKTIKSAIKTLKSFINTTAFFDQNDNMRLKEVIDAALEKDADLLQTWPLIKQALADFNLTNDVSGDVNISEEALAKILQEADQITKSIESLNQEKNAKKIIVDRFNRIMEDHKKEKQAQNKIAKDPKIIATLNQTQYVGPQILPEPKEFNPEKKKITSVLPRATVAPDSSSEYFKNETEKDHQVRANQFGANLWKFPNRKDIRGVYVTFKTQNQRLEGVIERLLDNNQELIDKYKDTAIAMVMIDSAGNLVGVDGLPIPEGEILLDKAIYQFMPAPGFRNGDMFRENTPQEVKDQITKQYAAWHKDQLERVLVPSPFEIIASSGIGEMNKNGEPNSVFSADLISRKDLKKKVLLNIPTTNKTIEKGTSVYNSPLGSVYLDVPSGLYKLQNRKFLKEEAESIYDALLGLSREVVDTVAGATSNEAVRLLNFLKGVTYWGIPKDAQGKRKDVGQNSVFFERQVVREVEGFPGLNYSKLVLRVGPTAQFTFTPKDIEANKSLIVGALENMYINVNKQYTEDINQPFEQIISVSPEGNVKSIVWPNYQSFMLSDVVDLVDRKTEGATRMSFEIPLTTQLESADDNVVNRKGIYFVDQSTIDDYIIKEVTPPRKEFIKTAPVTSSQFNAADGKTANFFKIKNGPRIRFVVTDSDVTAQNYEEKIKVDFRPQEVQEYLNKFPEGKDGKKILKASIYNFIQPNLAKQNTFDTAMSTGFELSEQEKKDLEARFGPAGSKRLVTKKEEPAPQQTSSVETVTYKGTRYSVDFNLDRANITNLKTGKVLEGGATSATGQAVLDLAIAQQTEKDNARFEKKQQGKIKSASISDVEAMLNKKLTGGDQPLLREMVEKDVQAMSEENWKDVRSWMEKNLPQVPLARVKNIIRSGGKTAWGMFQDNAMYVYENAEVGTPYHEAFEAVYAMYLTEKEKIQQDLAFRSRKGTFVDRPSGRVIKFEDATRDEIREQLAEEFRDYIQDKKKPKESFLARIFKSLKNFIESWFINPTQKKAVELRDELFNRIDTGDFAQLPTFRALAMREIREVIPESSAVFRVVTNLSGEVQVDLLEDMTYNTLTDLLLENKSVFDYQDINKTELYDKLKIKALEKLKVKIDAYDSIKNEQNKEEVDELIEKTITLMTQISENWDSITKRHQEYLQAYSITFDENDSIQVDKEGVENDLSNKGYNFDARKIDGFRKTNAAVRLMLATVPRVTIGSNGLAQRVPSKVNGVKLLPMAQVYVTLLDNLSSSTDTKDMLTRLQSIAENDPNYRTLYKRITGLDYTSGVSLENITEQHQLRLIDALFKTFKKQSPQVKVVNILENGEVSVSDADIASASRQIRQGYLNSIVSLSRQGRGIFVEKDGKYNPNIRKLNSYNMGTMGGRLGLLKDLGIIFSQQEYNSLSYDEKKSFNAAVSGIKASIANTKEIAFFSTKSLNMNKRLMDLAVIRVKLDNPEVSSTFFNVQGERTQTHIGPNVPSEIYNTLQNVDTLEELSQTPYGYLVTDTFSKNSVILNKYFDEDGEKNIFEDPLFKPGYAGGIANRSSGRNKKSSQLTYRESLIQEINLNLQGIYKNLVPADSGMEHTLFMGNNVSERDMVGPKVQLQTIIFGYFIDEVNLARQERRVESIFDSKDLRFFKDILNEYDPKLYQEVQQNIQDNNLTAEEVYDASATQIIDAFLAFTNKQTQTTINTLTANNIIVTIPEETRDTYSLPAIEGNLSGLTKDQVFRKLSYREINFVLNQMEMYKVLYGDPYAYKDITKRSKSFLSPRQLLSSDTMWNSKAEELWNRDHAEGSIGYTDFTRSYFKTATHADVIGISDLPGYETFEKTDGAGIISFKAYRNFRIRVSDWNPQEEKQYAYDIAYEKRDKKQLLTQRERDLLEEGNPDVKSAYKPLKPIVSGSKLDSSGVLSTFNNPVLDKYALYALPYRIIKELDPASNNIKLYEKMQREDIDYIIYKSGRKVGAEELHETYNEDGSFNDTAYSNVINVPFNAISLQQEVPSKDDGRVTRASQITKLATLDLFDSGVPVDYTGSLEEWLNLNKQQRLKASAIYNLANQNKELLDELTIDGMNTVMKRLGIVEKNGKLVVEDLTAATQTLREEIFKRETNDNVSVALDGFLNGDVVIEGTPAYNQVRNILYSIVQKNVVRPKISGRQAVQIPSALFEQGVKLVEINGKKGYVSDVLGFYKDEDGKRVMEVMVGRWFNSSLSDKDLLDYLNNTEEGQKALRGVAFRIPTQAQNSIDSIKIKQFLPREFGDQVVVPEALVKKVGSDFDIDKLFMYFKNMYYRFGELQTVPYFGKGEEAKAKIEELWEDGALLTKSQQQQLNEQIELFRDGGDVTDSLIFEMFGEVLLEEDVKDDFMLDLSEKGIKQTVVDRLYTQSLENEYIETLQNLIELPENFERLSAPNDASQLENISKEIVTKRFGEPFDYEKVSNLLNSQFTSRLRYSFVAGKKGIGVAAVNQVNLALLQSIPVLVPATNIPFASKNNVDINQSVVLNEGTEFEYTIDKWVSISGRKNANGEFISKINGQFIDGYVDIAGGPWIMELGATPQTAPTWLYLIRAGVPIKVVADFMNQPIVQDFIREVNNRGYSYLGNRSIRDGLLSSPKYDIGRELTKKEQDEIDTGKEINESMLSKMVGKKQFTDKEKLQQRKIIFSFQNVYQQAREIFTLTQGLNWDTSTFNDPMLVFKKQMQYAAANKLYNIGFVAYDLSTNSITSIPEAVMNNTFVGETLKSIIKSREGISNFLKSDQLRSRSVLENTLMPWVLRTFDKEFIKISRRAVNSLFDYVIQTNGQLNTLLSQYLLENDGKNVAARVEKFVDDVLSDASHPLYNNQVIRMLEINPSKRPGNTPINLQLRNNETKTYDQNSVIFGFEQIRNFLGDDSLYKDIVITAVLQSGLDTSPISFTSLLPYEDFKNLYNSSLSNLENISNLNNFYELGMFQRNNWSDGSIVPTIKAPTVTFQGRGGTNRFQNNPGMEWLPKNVKSQIAKGKIPQVVQLPFSFETLGNDYIVYTWPNKTFTAKERKEMALRGDFSFINKGLFVKTRQQNPDGTPGLPYTVEVPRKSGDDIEMFVYKHINALGDGFRAQEYYETSRPSVFDNGLLKAEERKDEDIIEVFESKPAKGKDERSTAERSWLTTMQGNMVRLGKVPNQIFTKEQITSQMLSEIGYNEDQIGQILKTVCKS